MGVSYANSVRPYVLSNLNGKRDLMPMFGSRGLFVHPGMMYHISLSWVVLFNLLHSIHDTCSAPADVVENHEVHGNSTTAYNHHMDGADIPELSAGLLLTQVSSQWQNRVRTRIDSCADTATEDLNNTAAQTRPKCFYAWMVNRMTRVSWPKDIDLVLQPNLVANERWKAAGYPIRQPRTGWLAGGRGSWFELAFTGIPAAVQHVTVIYMKSYSELWHNATLQISCFTERPQTNTTTTLQHLVSGYHLEETSILTPSKLKLPPNQAGDTLRLKFELIQGETFKITGLALC